MEEMPLVYVKRGKVIEGKSRINAVDRLKEIRKEGKKAYVLDLDGIKRNSPNLDIYRKLAHKPFLWIDALPRCLEDVMDLVVVGAERITIGDVVSDEELKKIREMCDVGLFLRGDDGVKAAEKAMKFGLDGIVMVSPKGRVDAPAWGVYPTQGVVKKMW